MRHFVCGVSRIGKARQKQGDKGESGSRTKGKKKKNNPKVLKTRPGNCEGCLNAHSGSSCVRQAPVPKALVH
jgi:hypothetical protein